MSTIKNSDKVEVFTSIIDTIPNPILEVDRDKIIRLANRSALDKWPDIKIGETKCGELLYEEMVSRDQCLVDRCIREKKPITELITNKNGDYFEVKTNYIGENLKERVILHIYDITEKINKENALRESEKRYRNIIEESPGAILIHIEGVIKYVNKACLDLLLYESEDELIGQSALTIVEESYRDLISKRMERAILDNERQPPVEVKLRKKDGSLIDVETTGVPVIYNNKSAVQAIIFDITNRKKMEERLRTSEEKYRTLALNIPLGVFRTTSKGEILSANPAISEIFGFKSPEEFKEANVNNLYSEPKDRKILIDKLMKNGKIRDYEVLFKRKNGEEFWGSVNETAILNKSGEIDFVDGIIVDISEKKLMEREVLKKEKLDSIGILAGGIAHDFNNILTAIIGNITLAKIDENVGIKVKERLERAENAIVRAKNLTRQLLTFSKGGEPIKTVINLTEAIKNTVQLSESGLKIMIDCNIADDIYPVYADEGQIGQVIQNLLINAVQAMPDGGKILVQVDNVPKESPELPATNKSDHLKISVADHGIGIPKEHLNKIFDPFFTTKQKGSGLGLSSVYSIVSNHGGFVNVSSELGRGTVFNIFLKAVLDTKGKKGGVSVEDKSGKDLNILIMDDEELILESLSELLKKRGYIVDISSSGEEAVEIVKEKSKSNSRYDIVILDLIVPGAMGGKEALNRIKKIDPGIKAIASSGYSTGRTMADYKNYGFNAALEKPFRISELEKIIKKVLVD